MVVMFSQTSFNIGRIFGIPLKIDISLLLVAGMFVFAPLSRNATLASALVAGLLSFAALAAAILVHELGHAVVALSYGCRVSEITLMFFGGYASISAMPRAPLKQAAISAAGPAAGFALWLLAGRLIHFAPGAALQYLLYEVARMSLYLSAFNLIPAIPLDGGNIFRAVLAHFKGRAYATQVSCEVAKWLAIAMGIYGLLGHGVFFIFLAFFVWAASRRELARAAHSTDGDSDNVDDDIVIISPPPGSSRKEYTRIRHRESDDGR